MRIAVAYENGNIFEHFGHTERFKVYDIENGEIAVATTINTDGSGHGALADILKKCGVDTLICGNLGAGAKRALADAGITLYAGVSGSADQAVKDLLQGKLVHHPDVECSHRGEHHQHSCGEHDGGCAHRHGCGDMDS